MGEENKKPLIGIIGGKGKMGNWFKIFFERQGLKIIISDKKTPLSNKEVARKADIVIVSVPINVVCKIIREIRNEVKKDALLTDLTSVKLEPISEMAKAKSGVLGMHPLFGPLQPDLKKQTIAFCRAKNNRWVLFLKKLFQKEGARIIEISPEEHDKQVTFLQALLHFTNINFAHFLSLKKFKSTPYFLTPTFKIQSLVLARILTQSPGLYADIEMFNPYFQKISKDYIEEIKKLQKIIEDKNYQEFEKRFNSAHSYLADYLKAGESKSTEILKVIDRQPVRMGKIKKIKIKKAKIGFLGPEGTFSWAAVKETFPETTGLYPFSSIKDVFEAVSSEEVNFGLVPIENTIGGLVSETIYSLIDHPIFVVDSFKMPIHHSLASRAKDLSQIKIVKSHPQALSQCKKWLDANLSEAMREATPSTVAPILEDLSEDDIGFIIPHLTAKKFKLNILAKNVEDNHENFTRFFIISQSLKRDKLGLKAKNTLLFLAVYDRVGILRDILNVFASRGINLSALHSISASFSSWDYLFFLELEKSYFDKDFKNVLKDLEEYCPFIRVVGIAKKDNKINFPRPPSWTTHARSARRLPETGKI